MKSLRSEQLKMIFAELLLEANIHQFYAESIRLNNDFLAHTIFIVFGSHIHDNMNKIETYPNRKRIFDVGIIICI
jgi:hypothetical protein